MSFGSLTQACPGTAWDMAHSDVGQSKSSAAAVSGRLIDRPTCGLLIDKK